MFPRVGPEQIAAAHQCYCQLTGQNLGLGYDRERQWFEWLRAGFTLEDLRQVIGYLQREIRERRRNVGALKLSNLLQPDRFEEDLNIRRVRLYPPPPPLPPPPAAALGAATRTQTSPLSGTNPPHQRYPSRRTANSTTDGYHGQACKPRSFHHGLTLK